MLDITEDIRSLSDFKRHTSELLDQMKRSGRPVVLTVNGKAELVVQDAASYQKLMDAIDRLDAIERVGQGLEEMRQGKARPARRVLEEIRRDVDRSRRS